MGTFPVGTQVSSPVGAGEPLTAAALTQPSLRRWVRPWREGQELCSKSPAGPHQPHTMFLISVIIPITLAEPTTLHLFPKAAVADRFSSRARNQTLLSHSIMLEREKRIAHPQQNWCKCQLWFENSPVIGKPSFSLISSSWVPKGSRIIIYENNKIIFEVWQCLLPGRLS